MKVKYQGRGWYQVRTVVMWPDGRHSITTSPVWVTSKDEFKALFPYWAQRSMT